MYQEFLSLTEMDLIDLLRKATTREENLFYQRLLSLKMGLAQEKVVGKELL